VRLVAPDEPETQRSTLERVRQFEEDDSAGQLDVGRRLGIRVLLLVPEEEDRLPVQLVSEQRRDVGDSQPTRIFGGRCQLALAPRRPRSWVAVLNTVIVQLGGALGRARDAGHRGETAAQLSPDQAVVLSDVSTAVHDPVSHFEGFRREIGTVEGSPG